MPTATKSKPKLSSIKKKYQWFPESTAVETRDIRSVKMLEPRCAEHENVTNPNWTEVCEAAGHDPFSTTTKLMEERQVFKVDEDGDEILDGVKRVQITKVVPNVTPITVSEGINDFRGVEKARKDGYVSMTERGYLPFCEMYNCWNEASPKWSGESGNFCSEYHKGVILLSEQQIPIHVSSGQRKRAQILEAARGA